MKINEIQDLIKFVAKSGVSEVELETKDFKIAIKTSNSKGKDQVFFQASSQPLQQVYMPQQQPAAPAPEPASAAPSATSKTGADESKYITIKSPMVGTFYRASGPDKPPFVSVGDEVVPGKVICIIEAMKLFNEVECDVKGKIVKVLANDVSPIEYDQPLFLVDPS
jgi:acetyl-CoA carboxylase biotin carboxyl carrier protein